MHYVYILKSIERNWIYTGSTADLKRRFSEHSSGNVRSTKLYRPLKLVFYEAFLTKADAIRRETYLKTSKGKSTLRMMLRHSVVIDDKTEPTIVSRETI